MHPVMLRCQVLHALHVSPRCAASLCASQGCPDTSSCSRTRRTPPATACYIVQVRDRIVPVNKRWPLAELIATMEVGWRRAGPPCWHAALCSAACSFCATYVDEADLPQVPGRATNSLPLLRVSAEAFWIPCAAAQELFPKDKAAPRHGHHVLVAYTMLRWGQRLSLWDVSAWLWCIHCCSEAGCALLQVASAVKTGGVQLL